MTVFTGAQIIVPNATAVAGAPKISNDTIDVAIATLSAYVTTYIRAKRWTSPAASGLVDRTAQSITTHNTGETYNSSDASFGGLPSISIAGCADTPYLVPREPSASWTFLSSLSITADKPSGKTHCLISATVSGGYGIDIYANSPCNGNGAVQEAGGLTHNLAGFPAADNTPCIFVCSYDSSTKIFRTGINGLPGIGQVTLTNSQPYISTDIYRLFGYLNDNGYNMLGKFETVAIFNAAAGAGGAIDSLLGAAITSMRSVYGF